MGRWVGEVGGGGVGGGGWGGAGGHSDICLELLFYLDGSGAGY
jgi:hypothetical protein